MTVTTNTWYTLGLLLKVSPLVYFTHQSVSLLKDIITNMWNTLGLLLKVSPLVYFTHQSVSLLKDNNKEPSLIQ